MTITQTKSAPPIVKSSPTSTNFGVWTILIVLLSLLAAAILVAYLGWTLGGDSDVPTSGYLAMALGVIASFAVGFGLMALVFYSSRKGYDEPPVLLVPRDGDQDSR